MAKFAIQCYYQNEFVFKLIYLINFFIFMLAEWIRTHPFIWDIKCIKAHIILNSVKCITENKNILLKKKLVDKFINMNLLRRMSQTGKFRGLHNYDLKSTLEY